RPSGSSIKMAKSFTFSIRRRSNLSPSFLAWAGNLSLVISRPLSSHSNGWHKWCQSRKIDSGVGLLRHGCPNLLLSCADVKFVSGHFSADHLVLQALYRRPNTL